MEKPKEKITRNLLAGIRPAVPLLLVIGLVLGPVYYGYCVIYSGTVARTVEMTERASRWVSPDGSILRFSNGQAYEPVALSLNPGMNRVTLRLKFAFADQIAGQETLELRYQASLAQLDHTILERPIELHIDVPETQSVDVGPLEIGYPAEYLFVLEEVGEVDLIPTLSLEVVEKLETPSRLIIWTGMGLLILAAIITVRDAITLAGRVRPR